MDNAPRWPRFRWKLEIVYADTYYIGTISYLFERCGMRDSGISLTKI